jgi:hypothetical protein
VAYLLNPIFVGKMVNCNNGSQRRGDHRHRDPAQNSVTDPELLDDPFHTRCCILFLNPALHRLTGLKFLPAGASPGPDPAGLKSWADRRAAAAQKCVLPR